MTTVLVSDTSVLIDLERGNLLEAAFAHTWEFVVPDLLYKRELKDHGGERLIALGLRVESLDETGLTLALAYQARSPVLSLADAFAIALAKTNDWMLLAGDGELRKLAAVEELDCHGVLWLLDQFHGAGNPSARELHQALTTIGAHPRCRLPHREIKRRLEVYAQAMQGEGE